MVIGIVIIIGGAVGIARGVHHAAVIVINRLGPPAGHSVPVNLAKSVVSELLVGAVGIIDPFDLIVSVACKPGGLPAFVCPARKIVRIVCVSVTEADDRVVAGVGHDTERANAWLAAGGSDVVSRVLKRRDITVAIIREVGGLVLEVGVIGKLRIAVGKRSGRAVAPRLGACRRAGDRKSRNGLAGGAAVFAQDLSVNCR